MMTKEDDLRSTKKPTAKNIHLKRHVQISPDAQDLKSMRESG